MKEQDFDGLVCVALSPQEARPQLCGMIDQRIQHLRRRMASGRRITFAAAGIGAFALAASLLMPSTAEAALQRMAGAIDGVESMQLSSYTVTDNGKLFPQHKVSYDRAKWRMEDALLSDVSLWSKGKLLVYKPQARCYVAVDSPNGLGTYNPKSMRLSDILGLGRNGRGGFQFDTAEFHGRKVTRVTVDVSYVNERQVFYADPDTQLPIEVQTFVKELGEWKLRVRTLCNYAPTFPKGFFDADPSIPVVSKESYEQKLVAGLTSDDLGHAPLAKGRLVIRAFEVASDGTVYVAYQSGDRAAHSWRGLGLSVSDDLGTPYARPIEVMGPLDEQFIERSKDGKLELEVFVPLNPALPWKPRRIDVGAHISPNGDLIRFIRAGVGQPDGTIKYRIQPNYSLAKSQPEDMAPEKPTCILSRKLMAPTCTEFPAFASLVEPMAFGGGFQARIYKARVRARQFMESEDWPNAERVLLESIRIKRDGQAQGFGGWSTSEDQQNLQNVRAKLNRP